MKKKLMLFVNSKPNLTVQTDLGKYVAGALSVIGLEGADAYNSEVREYVRTLWGFDAKTETWARDTRKDKIERDAVVSFLFNKGVAVLMADVDGVFSPSSLVELASQNPDQFEECYRTALRQNSKLAPAGWADPEADKFHAEDKETAGKKA
jgi:hypothetical protein